MNRLIKLKQNVSLMKENLLSLRFQGFAVTLSGFARGEYLPLPRSKGGAFPSLLTLGGGPTAAANFAQKQQLLPVREEEAVWDISGPLSWGRNSLKLNMVPLTGSALS